MILDLIKTGFGLAKDSPFKLLIIAGIITAVIGFVEFRLHAEYKRGYQKAQIEGQEREQKLLVDRAHKNQKRLTEVLSERDKWKDKAIELQSADPITVEIEVIKIVKENITNCPTIDGFSVMWNKLRENYKAN
tara:strand:- start:1189 stop:1587 length:399 start_codon:yes stop_codon:yes gene_type:complete